MIRPTDERIIARLVQEGLTRIQAINMLATMKFEEAMLAQDRKDR